PPVQPDHAPRLEDLGDAAELEAAAVEGRLSCAGDNEVGDLWMEVRTVRRGGQIRLDRTTLPATRAQVGAANHRGPRGCLVAFVELDLLVAVAREHAGCRDENNGRSRQRRCRPAGRGESPFPGNKNPKAHLFRWIGSRRGFSLRSRGRNKHLVAVKRGKRGGGNGWRGVS